MYRKNNIDWSRVIEDYESTGSIVEVAKMYGCSNGTVHYHLRKMGYKLPPKKGRKVPEDRRAKLAEINRRPEKREAARRGGIKALKRVQESNTWEPTPIEKKLTDALVARGISHRTQWTIGRYVVDVLLEEYPVIIEADGLHHRLPSGIKRDRERDQYLTFE
ncbi:endonuclease domain-containing protein [Alicyclobacillus vulcanalis]|uniref:endonuclease domain-containing protein n=1 Tax=Alicyclobacillus vulcanalis TaxID=252246 RepID=UPI0009708243